MKIKALSIIMTICAFAMLFSSCGEDRTKEAQAAVKKYNSAVDNYNKSISPYNKAINQIINNNKKLDSATDSAQESINKGDPPFDKNTLSELKKQLGKAVDVKVDTPILLKAYTKLSLKSGADFSELASIIKKATEGTKKIQKLKIPNTPDVPNYKKIIKALNKAHLNYRKSIQSFKQTTVPKDKFVIDRLKKVKTISAIEAVSENNDPNGMLNKQGGYIGCVYFTDTRVHRADLYIEDGKDGVVDIGTDGGGAVEIFKSVKEAETRNTYLGTFDGTGFTSGSHYVVGTCIIRTSNELNGSQQKDLTDKITKALTKVDKKV